MDIGFKIIIGAIIMIVVAIVAIGLISILSGQSNNLFAKLLCPWC